MHHSGMSKICDIIAVIVNKLLNVSILMHSNVVFSDLPLLHPLTAVVRPFHTADY